MNFRAFNPFIKQLRTDKGWRVEFDVPEIDYDKIKDIPKLQDKVLIITVELEDKPVEKKEEMFFDIS